MGEEGSSWWTDVDMRNWRQFPGRFGPTSKWLTAVVQIKKILQELRSPYTTCPDDINKYFCSSWETCPDRLMTTSFCVNRCYDRWLRRAVKRVFHFLTVLLPRGNNDLERGAWSTNLPRSTAESNSIWSSQGPYSIRKLLLNLPPHPLDTLITPTPAVPLRTRNKCLGKLIIATKKAAR